MSNKYFNNISVFALAFLVMFSLGSCKKFLEPDSPSLVSTSTVFSNVYTAKMTVLGVYQDLAGDQGYGNRISCYYPYDNDETMGPAKLGDNDRGDIAHYNATSLNLQLYAPYLQLYQGIERANLCIYYIPQMTLYTTGNAQQIAELKRLYGEALTLRAQFYLELTRNWGDVPAQFLPSEVSTNLYIGRTNRDTIYNHLLADLKFAADSLVPWKSKITALTGDPIDQRITQGAVRALRARIALYRAGKDLRVDGIHAPSDALTYYQIAWDECNKIINSGEHSLNPSYKSIFRDGICAHVMDNNYNEILFEVAMSGSTSLTDSKLGTYNGPKSDGAITLITPSTTSPITYSITSTYTYGSSTLIMLPTYFYLFDSSDARRDVTFAPYGVLADYSKVGTKLTAVSDGKFRADWVTNPGPSSSLYWGLDWPLIRYSDVLLMFAEADNEINKGSLSQSAINAITAVRSRAFPAGSPLASATVIPSGHDSIFQFIVRERALEFGAEGIRKYDLKRWGLLGTAIQQTKANIYSMMNLSTHSNLPTSYMAAPPSYCASGTLPTSVYMYMPDSTGNPSGQGKAYDDERIWATSFYGKQPSSAVVPVNTCKVSWISSSPATATASFNTTFLSYFGTGFQASHSELFPIPQAVIDASGGVLKQEYGY